MTIYKNVIGDILYELRHRDEVKAKFNFDTDMYYAYMVGKMTPIMEALVKAEEIKIGG